MSDQGCAATTGLVTALRPLVAAAEQVLARDAAPRRRTSLRLAAGGSRSDDLSWALARGSQVHPTESARQRARQLGRSVTAWLDDPQLPGRQVGWGTTPATDDAPAGQRLAVRWPRKDGPWAYAVVIATLPAGAVLAATGPPPEQARDPPAVPLAYVRCYDARGGGGATAITDDKPGLGLTTRSTQRVAAHQLVVLLGTLAHHVLVWARSWRAR